MSFPFLPKLRPSGCGDPGHEIPFACMFSGAQYLTRTPAVAGSRKLWSLSAWVKVSDFSGTYAFGAYTSTQSAFYLSPSSPSLRILQSVSGGSILDLTSSRNFRDPAAWSHLLLVVDADNATASERARVYVNGDRLSAFSSAAYPALAATAWSWLAASQQMVGCSILGSTLSGFFKGYLAAAITLDGIAAAPTDFGYLNRFGVWVPRRYSGAYGAQGWHLDFADPLNLGKDVSGNGNHFTASGLTAANQVTDTPTHGYPTYTPLNINTTMTLSDGNLTALKAGSYGSAMASILLPSTGKWYWEGKLVSAYDNYIGISRVVPGAGAYIGGDTNGYAYRSYAGTSYKVSNNGVGTAYGAPATTGDVVGVCYDADAGTIRFSVKGVLYDVAFSGLTGRFFPAVSNQWTNSGTGWTLNFGQRAFAYAPPAGFKSLASPNLPCPAIKRPNDYFTTRLASAGAGVADLPWSPLTIKTLVLSKRLDAVADWRVNDSLRPGRAWATNTAAADFAEAGGLAFTDTGYTVGAVAAYQGNRIDTIWRAAPAAGFDMLLVDHVSGAPTTVPHAVGGPVDYAWVVPLAGGNRRIFHRSLAAGQYVALNAEFVPATEAGWFVSSAVDVSLGASLPTGRYALYLWRAVPQFSAFGSYTGNGAVEGPFIPTDFAAGVVMERNLASTNQTYVLDTTRSPDNPLSRYTMLGYDYAEGSGINFGDVVANGLKLRSTATVFNGSGHACLYAAWAKTPGKFTRAR